MDSVLDYVNSIEATLLLATDRNLQDRDLVLQDAMEDILALTTQTSISRVPSYEFISPSVESETCCSDSELLCLAEQHFSIDKSQQEAHTPKIRRSIRKNKTQTKRKTSKKVSTDDNCSVVSELVC
mmetsp:Transcript_3137/g.5519  ORF Transcript_3137/g.5519 Transcript_3137/m.5519 type:complete len:126 (-) Transcript_3137:162-539(-)